jgi:UDP:flavonoid glycosyltransferase YjiC (YdhE family)
MMEVSAFPRSRVLFTAWPFPGHLFPQIAVAQALRQQGHDVAFYTGAEGARIAAAEGFTCFPFRQVDEPRRAHAGPAR